MLVRLREGEYRGEALYLLGLARARQLAVDDSHRVLDEIPAGSAWFAKIAALRSALHSDTDGDGISDHIEELLGTNLDDAKSAPA